MSKTHAKQLQLGNGSEPFLFKPLYYHANKTNYEPCRYLARSRSLISNLPWISKTYPTTLQSLFAWTATARRRLAQREASRWNAWRTGKTPQRARSRMRNPGTSSSGSRSFSSTKLIRNGSGSGTGWSLFCLSPCIITPTKPIKTMKNTFFIVINEDDVVRGTHGYRHKPLEDLGLYDLINNFGFSSRKAAQEKADYVNSFEKYAPGEEKHNIATEREARMGERAKQGYHVEEITVDYSLTRHDQ